MSTIPIADPIDGARIAFPSEAAPSPDDGIRIDARGSFAHEVIAELESNCSKAEIAYECTNESALGILEPVAAVVRFAEADDLRLSDYFADGGEVVRRRVPFE